MRVRYLGGTFSACDLYRASIPFSTLLDKGYDVDFLAPELERGRVQQETVEIETDVLIVPRPTTEFAYSFIAACRAAGIASVVEIDDDFDNIHPDNIAYEPLTRGLSWLHKSIAECDVVTVSTQALADRYGDKCIVVPNSVPDTIFDIPLSEEKWGVGWAGSITNHPNDLQQVGTALRKLARTGVKFRHIGRGNAGPIIKTSYTHYEHLEYGEYLHAISTFAIGIVPLEQSAFNNAKSYLKGIEYAALGVPFVASPVAEYVYLNTAHGLGLLATDQYAWYTGMRKLLRSDDALKEMSAEYRTIAYDTFRISLNDWRWVEAWDEARKRMRNG